MQVSCASYLAQKPSLLGKNTTLPPLGGSVVAGAGCKADVHLT